MVSTLWMKEAVYVHLIKDAQHNRAPPEVLSFRRDIKIDHLPGSCGQHVKLMAFSIRRPMKNLQLINEITPRSFTSTLLMGHMNWSASHGYIYILHLLILQLQLKVPLFN